MSQAGFAGFEASTWHGVVTRAGTPAAIVNRLNTVINDAVKTDEAQASLLKLSAITQPGSPQDFAAFIADQAPKWAELVKSGRIVTQ